MTASALAAVKAGQVDAYAAKLCKVHACAGNKQASTMHVTLTAAAVYVPTARPAWLCETQRHAGSRAVAGA